MLVSIGEGILGGVLEHPSSWVSGCGLGIGWEMHAVG